MTQPVNYFLIANNTLYAINNIPPGNYNVTIKAEDAYGDFVTQNFVITISSAFSSATPVLAINSDTYNNIVAYCTLPNNVSDNTRIQFQYKFTNDDDALNPDTDINDWITLKTTDINGNTITN